MMQWKKKIVSLFGIIVLITSTMLYTMNVENKKVVGASKSANANLRLIFTTDIHGQLNSTNYEKGTKQKTGGLARAFTAIKQARAEVLEDNYLTFDIGDVMYDYTTEYFYSEHPKQLQPIYQAMSKIGYDAITLGNHEFDYDQDYIRKQLEQADLLDKTVVSNLTESMSGKYPFLENMIITKNLKTEDGSTVKVKVGIIGETFPYLSTKGQDYTGVLKVEKLVKNVTTQAKKLKSKGADIVVVLSHAGFGPENPTEEETNTSYALTKIDEVDAVLCGHEHNRFPTEQQTENYYKLQGIDKSTNLANGKNIVMAEDRGDGIGIVDLGLSIDNGKVSVTSRKSESRKITGSFAEDASIAGLYEDYEDELSRYTKEVICKIKKEDLIQNYNGYVEDTSAIQLINDARRTYAINYIHNKATAYKDYPVVAVSTYKAYGQDSYKDYVNMSGEITESDLASLQDYNGYTSIYKITGAQLREWLEWSASAYTQVDQPEEFQVGSSIGEVASSTRYNSLVEEDWLDNWGSFAIFDGIEYTINPSSPARYNRSGVKINSTFRVSNITYNGKPVTDSQVIVLVSGKLAKTTEANQGINSQGIYKGYVRTQGIIRDYISLKCKLGSLDIEPDNNWRIALSPDYKFLVKTTMLGESLLKDSFWFVKEVARKENYIYSIGRYPNESHSKIKILLTPTSKEETSSKVKVVVTATSSRTVKEIRYLLGEYDAKDNVWATANVVKSGYFNVDSNGVYSVLAIDENGERAVEKIKIDNINSATMKKPTVDNYTNRKTKIKGTAQPGSTVVFKTEKKEYKTVANTEGTYSYALPAQNSGTKLTVYAISADGKKKSEEVVVTIKRTGPNCPTIETVNNNADSISGSLNDTDANVLAIINGVVYVGNKATKELYLNSKDLYNEDYKVKITGVRVDNNQRYQLTIPVQQKDVEIQVYTLDHISRASRVATAKVKDAAPNPPKVCTVVECDDKIEGYVSSSNKKSSIKVFVAVNNKEYTTTADEDGYFCVNVSPKDLVVGRSVEVYAQDTKDAIDRVSYTTSVLVEDPEKYVDNDGSISLDEVYTNYTEINGYYEYSEDLTISVKSQGQYSVYHRTPDDDGYFAVEFNERLKEGDIIYIHAMDQSGKISEMTKVVIENLVPSDPIVSNITNATTEVKVYEDIECTVVVKIGSQKYKTAKSTFIDEKGLFEYTITIPRTKSKEKVTVYAYSDSATSKKMDYVVKKVVPEAPKVKAVDTEAKKITGTIDVLGDTRVYAEIDDCIYVGKVKSNGTYTIEIPKQKKGTKIKVWGENEKGVGFSKTIKVVKAKKQNK